MSIAVAVFNRKGGVSKTTLSVILTEIALARHTSVLAVDLDPSENFSDALNLLKETSFAAHLNMKQTLEDSDANAPEDWIIIDCPPMLDDFSEHAMDFADIMLVPVRPDFFSLSNVGRLVAMAERKYGKSQAQLPLVKVGFDDSAIARIANDIINDNGYPVAGDLPYHKSIPLNILSGKIWSMGLMARHRQPYERLFGKLSKAVDRLGSGADIHDVWTSWRGDE